MFRLRLFSTTLMLAFVVAACSGKSLNPFAKDGGSGSGDTVLVEKDPTAEALYDEAMELMAAKRYTKAVENFQEIERLYPYSSWSTQGQVMSAFSYYKEEEYEDALATIDHFLHLNPGNKSAPYMYYLKALSYYDRISDVRRDQAITQEALNALNEVIRRYPDTEYGRDAKLKIDLVHDHLAGKEMEVGRFYLKRHNYIAAQNRFRKVIESYETTTHAPEALYRMVEVYLSLGLPAEAQKYAAVLGHNFPSNKWYHAAYRLINEGEAADEEPSWASRLLPTFGSDEVESEEDNGPSLIDRMTDNIGDLF